MPSDETTLRPPAPNRGFPTTHWTVIIGSGGQSLESDAALEELCRAYWHPLYAFVRRSGIRPHDAQDLVQGFIHRLIERRDLATLSPDKGRFRTYLLTALRNYVIKQAEHQKAAKRGGGRPLLSLDADEAERFTLPDLSAESPEVAFDRQWAKTVLRRGLERLRSEFIARNKEPLFEALLPCLEGVEAKEYEGLEAKLGMKKGAIAVTVHRMRGRLQELLRAEVLQTVGSGPEAEKELLELLETLARR